MSMDQAKKAKKIKYWISYRLPTGKQRRESVDAYEDLNGYSIEDARTAFSKKRVDKKENRMFDVKKDTKMTFNELTDWYLKLEKVKELASYDTICINMRKFNDVFGCNHRLSYPPKASF